MERKAFLDQEAPPGYVAGLGRGATGFTTQADIGGANLNPPTNSDSEDEAYKDADEDGLLQRQDWDREDEEADRIYKEIEDRLNSRRKRKTDDEKKEYNSMQDIGAQFKDLKEELSTVTKAQWLELPEVGDLTRRNKRLRQLDQEQQRHYAVPDSIVGGQLNAENTDLKAISSAKDALLSFNLDQNATKNESVNADAYLQTMEKSQDFGDLEKGRVILSSLRKSQPQNASSWISSARLEEKYKNFDQARWYISKGCDLCPRSADIWLESLRLNQNDVKLCRVTVTEAIKLNSHSTKLWMKAASLEADDFSRKRIFRKALEYNSGSVELWSCLVELETDNEDKKKLLQRAIELIPDSLDLTLALLNLETDCTQLKLLIKDAKERLPQCLGLWVKEFKVEEDHSHSAQNVRKLVESCLQHLETMVITRKRWLDICTQAESDGHLITCRTVLESIADLDLAAMDKKDKLNIWNNEISRLLQEGAHHTVQYMYSYIVSAYSEDVDCWLEYINVVKLHDSQDKLYSVFEEAVSKAGQNEILWLMYAKDKWQVSGDIEAAKRILQRGFAAVENSADMWCAIVKLECWEENYEKALSLYQDARDALPETPKLWYKNVTLMRQLNMVEDALDLVEEGIERFPECDKFYLQKGQILESQQKFKQAREAYLEGTSEVPSSASVWIALCRVTEKKLGIVIRARTDLDNALNVNSKSVSLWRERVRFEKRNNNMSHAQSLLNKALKLNPHAPELWCERILFAGKPQQLKNLTMDALKQTDANYQVVLLYASQLWKQNKISIARKWFEKALQSNKAIGDSWAWFYVFLRKNGTDGEVEQLVKDFSQTEVTHGEIYCSVNKDVKNWRKTPLQILEIVAERLI